MEKVTYIEDLEEYEYSPLTSADSIRLIQLQPAPDKDHPIQCRLLQTTIQWVEEDILDHYTALSYVWGDQNDQVYILVDGKKLHVTRSLDCALRNLRDAWRFMNIWADGICINQNDDREKNHQVLQMAKIYMTAHHTVIFLGDDLTKTTRINKCHLSLHNNSYIPFDEMASRPWFGRVWTFQELIVSKDPRIQYGSYRCTWDFFQNFAHSKALEPSFMTIKKMQEARAYYQLSQASLKYSDTTTNERSPRNSIYSPEISLIYDKFLDILVSRRGFGVSNARDMIFAHIGLVKDIDIPIDYSISVAETYQSFALHHIKVTKSFKILSHVEDVEPSFRRPMLASWAPDWTKSLSSPRIRIMDYQADQSHSRVYLEPDPTDSQPFRSYYFDDVSYSCWIHVKDIFYSHGYSVSIIKHISDIIENKNLDLDTHPRINGLNSWGDTPGRQTDEWYVDAYRWWRSRLSVNKNLLPPLSNIPYHSLRKTEDWKRKYGASSLEKIADDSIIDLQFSIPHLFEESAPFVFDHLLKKGETHQESIMDGRRLARMESGQLALVPASTKPEDLICFFKGCATPFVFREIPFVLRFENESSTSTDVVEMAFGGMEVRDHRPLLHVNLVGECFIDGALFGIKGGNRLLDVVLATDEITLAVH